MAEAIQFTLNGVPQTAAIEPADKIIDVLREHLNLTGTKRGCDDGTCGACTIVLDGEAKRACLLPAQKLAGAAVLTIEGLSRAALTIEGAGAVLFRHVEGPSPRDAGVVLTQ